MAFLDSQNALLATQTVLTAVALGLYAKTTHPKDYEEAKKQATKALVWGGVVAIVLIIYLNSQKQQSLDPVTNPF
jgi:multisubunit Na+/H+ antiporter MnhB subunit